MPDFRQAFSFDQPFQEAVDAFLAKGVMTRAEFNLLSREIKKKAFTAAHVAAADDLQAVYEAVLEALKTGLTLADFTRTVGESLTNDWHRETVFRTNILSAYGEGHWQQAQQTREVRPYARYSAVMDGRTRPDHAALHGLVYPLDSPFWARYWPPWDYNCRCAAITLSQDEIAREGLEVQHKMSGLPAPAKDFQSPAAEGKWTPDYSRYAPELGHQVKRAVEKPIYD